MTTIHWHPAAERELFEASDYYDAEERGLGAIFLDTVESTLGRLQRHPWSGPRARSRARRIIAGKFPYDIVYRVDPEGLFILAIAHHKRRHHYWLRRLRG